MEDDDHIETDFSKPLPEWARAGSKFIGEKTIKSFWFERIGQTNNGDPIFRLFVRLHIKRHEFMMHADRDARGKEFFKLTVYEKNGPQGEVHLYAANDDEKRALFSSVDYDKLIGNETRYQIQLTFIPRIWGAFKKKD